MGGRSDAVRSCSDAEDRRQRSDFGQPLDSRAPGPSQRPRWPIGWFVDATVDVTGDAIRVVIWRTSDPKAQLSSSTPTDKAAAVFRRARSSSTTSNASCIDRGRLIATTPRHLQCDARLHEFRRRLKAGDPRSPCIETVSAAMPPSVSAPVPRPTISSRRARFSSPADMTSSVTAWRPRADLLE